MPFSVGDGYILEGKIICQMQNQTAYVVQHFRTANLVGTIDIVAIGANFNPQVASQIKAMMTDQADFRGISMQCLSPVVSALTYEPSSQGPGTAGSTPMPKQVSGILSKRSSSGGRHGVGRAYIMFPDEADNEADATCTASYRTRMATLAASYLSPTTVTVGANSIDVIPVILDRGTFATLDVDFVITRDRWGTQRRRGDYGATSNPPI